MFLTGGTDTPDDFLERRDDGVIRSVRTWRDVGDWILDEVPFENQDRTHCALASELHRFLKEQNLMTKYLSARDLAAAMLFLPSNKALQTTFNDVMKAVASHAPKLRGSRRMTTKFWDEVSS